MELIKKMVMFKVQVPVEVPINSTEEEVIRAAVDAYNENDIDSLWIDSNQAMDVQDVVYTSKIGTSYTRNMVLQEIRFWMDQTDPFKSFDKDRKVLLEPIVYEKVMGIIDWQHPYTVLTEFDEETIGEILSSHVMTLPLKRKVLDLTNLQLHFLADLVTFEIQHMYREGEDQSEHEKLQFLSTLQDQLVSSDDQQNFLVVVEDEFVRDTQIASVPEADPMDDEGWNDTTGEHVLGVFSAKNADEAIGQASEICHVSGEMLKAYPLLQYSSERMGGEVSGFL